MATKAVEWVLVGKPGIPPRFELVETSEWLVVTYSLHVLYSAEAKKL